MPAERVVGRNSFLREATSAVDAVSSSQVEQARLRIELAKAAALADIGKYLDRIATVLEQGQPLPTHDVSAISPGNFSGVAPATSDEQSRSLERDRFDSPAR